MTDLIKISHEESDDLTFASGVPNAETDEIAATEKTSCCPHTWRRIFPSGFKKELKGTMTIAWALILTQVSQVLFQPVATMFGGHLGKLELDAIALSNTLVNVIGNSIVIGFATALDTVFSQSFGLGNYKILGTYLQKGIILHLLLLMPCYALHLNIKPILLALGQPEAVVELTSDYLLYFMPGMFFMFMWTTLRKFTQCQNAVVPHTIITVIGHAVHALLQYLFLYYFKFGIIGSSVAQATTFFVMFVLTVIYTVCSSAYKRSWGGWSRQCLVDWGPLASLGMFGMLMQCLEWWAFEASVLIAGSLDDTQLGAQSVAFNLDSLWFGVPSGIALATNIRVGQFLGASQRLAALTAARVGMCITSFISIAWAILFIAARSELPKLFTEDIDVINLVSQIIPFLSVYILFDGGFRTEQMDRFNQLKTKLYKVEIFIDGQPSISVVARGVFRGVGKQKWATIVIFIAYYVIALPIGIPITLTTPLGIKGIWIGFSISLFFCVLVYLIMINYIFNWETLEKEALDRARGVTGRKKVEKGKNDEEKPLLQGSLSVSGLVTHVTYISPSLYVKRAATIIFFLLLPVAGLIVRLSTQSSAAATSFPEVSNSSVPLMNTTVTTMAFTTQF